MIPVKIFLGGTCGSNPEQYDWRKDLIKKLPYGFTYYDPFLRPWETDQEWNEEVQKKEIEENVTSDVHIYLITSDVSGIYSFCEAVRDSIKFKYDTVIVGVCDYADKFTPEFMHSVEAFLRLCENEGATIKSGKDAVDQIVSYLSYIFDDVINNPIEEI